jgi:nuclear transport factor 2 (NTF2) superfamily protein
VALCREDADWCDGARLVKGRGRIAEFLKREWGAQSDRVQRTRVFTSGQNRVAACFERE